LCSYLVFWNSLPERMGVHIGLNGRTDGWMSREASLLISFFGLLILLLVSTWQVKRHQFSTRRLLRHCAGACILTACLMFVLLRNL
jgi:uncharacterized membrane protein